MGRNIFAPPSPGEQADAPAGQGSNPPQKKGRNIFQAPQYDDYKAPPEIDLSGYSKEQLLEAYKNLPRDDPRRAQVKAKLVNDSSEYFNREVMDPWASYAAGTMEGTSLGWSDEINAALTGITGGLYSPLGGKTYDEELQLQREQLKNAEKDNPGPYFAGQLTGGAIQAAPTLGMSIPESMGMRLLSNIAGGAAQGAAYSAGEDNGDLESRLGAGASGALWGAGFGAIPTAGEAIWKGGKAIASKTAQGVRKVTNPFLAAENDIVDRGVRDRVAQFRNEQQPNPPQRRFLTQEDVDAAMARGDDVMVSDLLGDGGRRRLKAAANVSEDASNLMRGAADGRQQVQSQTFMDTLSDMTGDNDPATIVERLKQMAKQENDAAYGIVENHPNASSMWNTQLQRAISTPEGREALKAALANSRRDAINKGHSIFEPVFEEGPDGLMQWTGRLRRPTGEMADDVQGMGIGFRFWDSVKKSFDDQITALYKGGYNEEARAVRATRDQMVASLDNMLTDGNGNSLYARARGTAKEFFDAEDAHEAGMKYFERMGAFKTSEVRRELGKMSPSERELFARGYAAALMHSVSSLGRGEEVSKLFRSVESRRKMVDALGPHLANQIEAITHVRMVQGLLGRELQSGSSTVLQNIAQEGMKYTAATTAGGGLGYYQTNDYTGLFAGMAIGGGFRFTQRKVVERYARALAEVARSNDPAVIARISKRISEDPRLMEFTRAAAAGAQRASAAGSRVTGGAGAAQQGASEINIPGGDLPIGNDWGGGRIEPRMPFADGGVVEEDPVPFKGGGLAKAAVDVIGDWLWRAEPEVAQELGLVGKAMPEHVDTFGHYMKDMAEKAGNEGLSDRDLIKAYTITRSSIQRGAVDAEKLRANGFDIPGASGMVRPEGAFSEWLLTPMGKRYLDNAEMGVVDEEAILDAQSKMAPFGKHETDLPDFMRNAVNLRGRAEETSGLVDRAYRGLSDPQEWRDATEGLRGIGPSKKGFYASLLGRGDQPTLDARQITLHTGKPTKEASKYIARRGGKGGEAAVDRLAERQRNMDMQVAPELEPFYQHLAHHTVWDTVANERTTHEDIIRAMRLAAAAGALPAGVAAMGEENLLNAMGGDQEYADGGRVGFSKGSLVKATFAQMMKLAGITDERDMKAIAQAYGNATKLHPKEWEYEYRDLKNIMRPEGVFDPEQAVRDRAVMLQLYGDRSPAGRDLVSINGKKLSSPVHQQGGNEFIYGPNSRAADPAVWASLPGAVSTLLGRVRAGAGEGPVYGVFSAMGPKGIDFSTMPLKSALGQAAVRNDVAALRAFDEHMLGKLDGKEGYPGIATAPGRKAMLSNIEGMGGMRAAMIKELDTDPFREMGLPDMGPIRWANTDPALLDVSTGATGRSIARLDPSGRRVIGMPDPHETYQHGVGGTPAPGYDMNIPADVWFSDYFRPRLKALGIDRLGEEGLPGTELYAMSRSDVTQRATQEWLDTLMNYRRAVEEGKIKPLTGPRAKPLKGRGK